VIKNALQNRMKHNSNLLWFLLTQKDLYKAIRTSWILKLKKKALILCIFLLYSPLILLPLIEAKVKKKAEYGYIHPMNTFDI